MKRRLIFVFMLCAMLYAFCVPLHAEIFSPGSITINFASADISARSATLPATHTTSLRMTQEIKITIPNSTNVITWTFAIVDAGGATAYGITGLVKSVTHILLVNRIVKPGYSYSLTPSGAPGSAVTITINPEYID